MNKYENLILTDIDGVCLNWEYAFENFMEDFGYERRKDLNTYDVAETYYISKAEAKKMVRMFNQSAAIAYLPPLRDAIQYIRKLHEEHGFVFHAITSLSKDQNAQRLRTKNLKKLFGETAFEKFVYLDTGADKDEALEEYRGTGCVWVEDKVENALLGLELGLDSLLMEHGHNMENKAVKLVKNWKDIYWHVAGE